MDLIASAQGEEYQAALDLILADDSIDSVIVIYTDPMISDASDISRAVTEAAAGSSKPLVASFLATGVGSLLKSQAGEGAEGVPVYDFPEAAASSLGRAVSLGTWRSRPEGTQPIFADVDAARVRATIDRQLSNGVDGAWLNPSDTSGVLAGYGIDMIESVTVTSASEAQSVAESMDSAVALKVVSDSIVHKTDVGGVVLDLDRPAEVAAAFEAMSQRLGDAMAGAIVQPMAPAGPEVIVGVLQDPTFGPVIMFGTGGTMAELWQDRSHALVPLTEQRAAQLINQPRGAALLHGYRGTPTADLAALEELVLRMSELADGQPRVAELELNPVIVTSEGCQIVDARCRVAAPSPREHPEWRRLPSHGV